MTRYRGRAETMSILSEIAAVFSLWIDAVARTVSAPLANIKPVRRIEVVEDEAGAFTMQLVTKTRIRERRFASVSHRCGRWQR